MVYCALTCQAREVQWLSSQSGGALTAAHWNVSDGYELGPMAILMAPHPKHHISTEVLRLRVLGSLHSYQYSLLRPRPFDY